MNYILLIYHTKKKMPKIKKKIQKKILKKMTKKKKPKIIKIIRIIRIIKKNQKKLNQFQNQLKLMDIALELLKKIKIWMKLKKQEERIKKELRKNRDKFDLNL